MAVIGKKINEYNSPLIVNHFSVASDPCCLFNHSQYIIKLQLVVVLVQLKMMFVQLCGSRAAFAVVGRSPREGHKSPCLSSCRLGSSTVILSICTVLEKTNNAWKVILAPGALGILENSKIYIYRFRKIVKWRRPRRAAQGKQTWRRRRSLGLLRPSAAVVGLTADAAAPTAKGVWGIPRWTRGLPGVPTSSSSALAAA
jgi:hypothetical protein